MSNRLEAWAVTFDFDGDKGVYLHDDEEEVLWVETGDSPLSAPIQVLVSVLTRTWGHGVGYGLFKNDRFLSFRYAPFKWGLHVFTRFGPLSGGEDFCYSPKDVYRVFCQLVETGKILVSDDELEDIKSGIEELTLRDTCP